MGVLDDIAGDIDVECPRCRRAVQQQFYGPCERCLAELRLAYQAEATAAEAVQVNIFTAVLSGLKGLVETKAKLGSEEVKKAAVNLVQG